MKKLISLLLCIVCVLPSTIYAKDDLKIEIVEVERFPFSFKTDITYKFKLDGWAFTLDQEKKLRFRLLDADYLEKENKLLKDNIEQYKKMLEIEKEISNKYKETWLQSDEQLTKVLKRESRAKLWYLILGIGLTIGAGAAISHVGR